jgi:hypothetical protein
MEEAVVPEFTLSSEFGPVSSGVFPGSTRVFGMDTPNAIPGNSCIVIFSVRPERRARSAARQRI